MEQLGRYRLFHELGAGGFASVYKAEMVSPEGFRSLVAVKRLHPHLTRAETGIVESLMTEAKACSRIHHHNVVQVYELSSEPDERGDLQWFMVMELVEGASLEELPLMAAKRGEQLPPGVILHQLIQIADGLHHVHTLTDDDGRPIGLIHRDLKPSNVLVRFDGVAKILDFGIAKSLYEGGPQTATGITRGTAAYMAPEQAFAKPLTPKADQFAFAALLFFVVVGEQLVRAESLAAELLFVVNTPAGYRADDVDARVPGLGAVFQRMRQPRLEDRYASMADVAADLQRVQMSLADPTDPEAYLADLVADPQAQVSPREMMRFRGLDPGEAGADALSLAQLGPQTLDRQGRIVPAQDAARSWGLDTTPSGRAIDAARPGPTTPSGPALALDDPDLSGGIDEADRLTAELPGLPSGIGPLTADLPELTTDEQEAVGSGDLPRAQVEDGVSSSSPRALDSAEVVAAGSTPDPSREMPVALDSASQAALSGAGEEVADRPSGSQPASPSPSAEGARSPVARPRSWGWLLLVPLMLGALALVLVALVSLLLYDPPPAEEPIGDDPVVIADREPDPFGRPDPEDIVVESEEDRSASDERRQRRRERREQERQERKEAERAAAAAAEAGEDGAEEAGEAGAEEASEDGAEEANADGSGDDESGSEATVETGVLKLNAYPAAEVFVDGKSVGTTLDTARGVRLPVGKHRIRLQRTTDGFERSFSVTIKAKKVLSVPFEWEDE